MRKKNQPPSIPTLIGNRNWLEWLEIETTSREDLTEKANRLNVPIFKDDTDRDIYERLASAETLKFNKRTVYINLFLVFLAFVSALVSIFGLFKI